MLNGNSKRDKSPQSTASRVPVAWYRSRTGGERQQESPCYLRVKTRPFLATSGNGAERPARQSRSRHASRFATSRSFQRQRFERRFGSSAGVRTPGGGYVLRVVASLPIPMVPQGQLSF